MLDNEHAVASFRLRPARSTRSSQQLRFEKDFKVKEVEDNKEAKDARVPRCAKEIPKYREETTSLQADQVCVSAAMCTAGGHSGRLWWPHQGAANATCAKAERRAPCLQKFMLMFEMFA